MRLKNCVFGAIQHCIQILWNLLQLLLLKILLDLSLWTRHNFLQHQQRVTTLRVKLHRIYISPTKREHEKEVKNWCNLQHLGSLISKFQSRQKNNAHVQSCRFRNLDTTFWGRFLATKSFGVSSYTQILQVDYHKKSPKKILEEWTKECCREELTWVSWTPKHFVQDLKRGRPFKKPNFWQCLIGVFQSFKLLGCDMMLFEWWEIEHLNSQSLFLQMFTKSPTLHGMLTTAAEAAAAEVWICQVLTSDFRLVVAVLLDHNWLTVELASISSSSEHEAEAVAPRTSILLLLLFPFSDIWFQDANSLTCQCNASCILLAPPRQG